MIKKGIITVNDGANKIRINTDSEYFRQYQVAAENSGIRSDAAFFVARQLEFLRQKLYLPVHSQFKLLNNGLLPLNTAVPAGAEQDVYDVMDQFGEANIIADFGDDINTVDVTKEQFFGQIKSIGAAYKYSVQDERRDQFAGGGVNSSVLNKAMTARRAIDQGLEKMLSIGAVERGIYGFYNNPNVPAGAVAATGTGSATEWETKTPQLILDDVKAALDDMNDASKGNEEPTHMLLNYKKFNILKTTHIAAGTSTRTLLKILQEDYNLTVQWTAQITNVFLGGTKNGFILYQNDQEKVEGVLPIRLVTHPAQAKNLSTMVIVEGRCGGVRVFYPKSISYSYGI